MRVIAFLAVSVMLSSCSKEVLKEPPLGSFMPAYLNVDSIQPIVMDDTNKVVKPEMQDFVSIPVDSGLLVSPYGKQTLPDGVLISERKAVLYSFYKSSWERQQKELFYCKYLMKEYYDKSKQAEVMYQQEILRWRKIAQRSWFERNMGYIGFGAGVFTMMAVNYALFQIMR